MLDLSDPHDLPVVRFNTLMNPVTPRTSSSSSSASAASGKNPQLTHLAPLEFAPGPQFQTDEEILAALTGNQIFLWPSLAHPAGTCAMMPAARGMCGARSEGLQVRRRGATHRPCRRPPADTRRRAAGDGISQRGGSEGCFLLAGVDADGLHRAVGGKYWVVWNHWSS